MNTIQHLGHLFSTASKTSNLLITLIGILLISVIILFSLIYTTYKSVEDDAYLINHLGIIRGSIQQFSKHAINGCNTRCEEIQIRIDNEFNLLRELLRNYKSVNKDELEQKFTKIQNYWNKIKSTNTNLSISQYNSRVMIFSESAWEISDDTVLIAEMSTREKLSHLKLSYTIFGYTIAGFIFVLLFIYKHIKQELEKEALSDPLTDIGNRRAFNMAMKKEIARAIRYKHPLTIGLFDIDNFKRINDIGGHKHGDQAIIEIINCVKHSIRSIDSVYRIGGDEFAILFPDTSYDDTKDLCQRLVTSVNKILLMKTGSLSISIGVVEYKSHYSEEQFIQLADQALLTAKKEGKNRVFAG